MKITKSQLRDIIKEEIDGTLDEKFRMPPELVKKCQKLASDIKMNAGILQNLEPDLEANTAVAGIGGKYNSAEFGYAMIYRNFMQEAQKVYKQMKCDGVLRNVNEDLY
jgi:hypothetical protein